MKEEVTNAKATKGNGKWQSPTGETAPKADAATETPDIEAIQSQMIETAKQTYGKVVEGASQALSNVNLGGAKSFVSKYPVQTAVGALAVGFLIGAAVSRRTT